MNILTISNDGWIESHGVRWLRFARRSNPGAKLILVYTGDGDESTKYIRDMFDRVIAYPASCAGRDWYNVIRMKRDELGLDEYLYCDLDADILQDMSHVQERNGDIMWVRSPAVSEEWKQICIEKGWKDWGANNGLLYIRKDYSQRYEEILGTLKSEGCSPRIVGTYAFNQLIRENKEAMTEIPYYNSVIWWDYQNLTVAKTIQWCNDRGHGKRLLLEQTWRDAL